MKQIKFTRGEVALLDRVKCSVSSCRLPHFLYSLVYFKIHEILKLYTTIKKFIFYLKISLKYKLKVIQPITK